MTKTRWLKWFSAGATTLLLSVFVMPIALGGSAGAALGTPPTQSMKTPSSIGKSEGALNIIAWEGYTQPQWVKPFESTTGCQVNVKYAGS